jgi:pyruvate dehydrogenase E2 component (dihydrolipoamide acetyltransferase)
MARNVTLPKMGANMIDGTIGKWHKKEGDAVRDGDVLFELATDKATFDILAESSGILKRIFYKENTCPAVGEVVAVIGAPEEKIDVTSLMVHGKTPQKIEHDKVLDASIITAHIRQGDKRVKATPLARKIAREKNIDISKIHGTGPQKRVTEKDVYQHYSSNRVVLLGAGNCGEVVCNILKYDSSVSITGFFDDNDEIQNTEKYGFSVLGRIDRIQKAFAKKQFDAALISISLDIQVKRKWYMMLKKIGIPLINAIHPKAIIDDNVVLGEGNIILSNAHIGYSTVIGSNNFIASNVNIDHHNSVGSHCLISPACSTSSEVSIGNSCIIGTGVFIQNVILIGNNVTIASGSVVYTDVPDHYEIRKKFVKEEMPVKKECSSKDSIYI